MHRALLHPALRIAAWVAVAGLLGLAYHLRQPAPVALTPLAESALQPPPQQPGTSPERCPPKASWPAGMVCVQGGTLRLAAGPCASPEPVIVETFFIDEAEVTAESWEDCADRCACQSLPIKEGVLTGMTEEQAVRYCTGLGKRLPSSLEWLRAPLSGTADRTAMLEDRGRCLVELPDNLGLRCAVGLEDGAEALDRHDMTLAEASEAGAQSWYRHDADFRRARERPIGIGDLSASYKDPRMAEALLRNYAERFAEVTSLVELGRTHEGRPLLALRITDPAVPAAEKPAIFLNGGHHGHELLGVEYAFDAIDQILGGWRSGDVASRAWVQGLDIWVVPVVNPDGLWTAIYLNHGGPRERTGARKNGRDMPTLCGASERRDGVDLNRNYPLGWGQEPGSSADRSAWNYRGLEAASEPETRAIMALAERARFVASLTYHTRGPMLLSPYTIANYTNPSPDVAWGVAEAITTSTFPVRAEMHAVSGTDQDWLFHTYGTLAYILEGDAHNPLSAQERRASVAASWAVTRNLLERVLRGPRLQGGVQDVSGRPLEAEVSIVGHTRSAGEVWTSRPDGRFDQLVLEDGVYTIEAMHQGRRVHVEADTRSGQPVVVIIP